MNSKEATTNLHTENGLEWNGNTISGLAYKISLLTKNQPLGKIHLILPDDEQIKEFRQSLTFFTRFLGLEEKLSLYICQGWETSPYQWLIPSPKIRSDKISFYHSLFKPNANEQSLIFVSSAQSLLEPYPDKEFIQKSLYLKESQLINLDSLKVELEILGYKPTEFIESAGSYCIKGGIIEIYPSNHPLPLRIELEFDGIEAIHSFDLESQLNTGNKVQGIELIPVQLISSDPASTELLRSNIKDWCDKNDIPKSIRDKYTKPIQENIFYPQTEYFLTFLNENRKKHIFDDLEIKHLFYEYDEIEKKQNSFLATEEKKFKLAKDKDIILPAPEEFYTNRLPDFTQKNLKKIGRISMEKPESWLPIQTTNSNKKVDLVIQFISEKTQIRKKIIIACNTNIQLERIKSILNIHLISYQIITNKNQITDTTNVYLFNETIGDSLECDFDELIFISEDVFFGKKNHHSTSEKRKKPTFYTDDLTVGDLVVHKIHGKGRYIGLEKVSSLGDQEFIRLEYQGDDKLYVPVYRMDLLSKYSGPSNENRLDKLGGNIFRSEKKKAKESAAKIAIDLLKLQAIRSTGRGFHFNEIDQDFESFESTFPFEETLDQETAIQDTIRDMCSDKIMDRLICGDVGFGKTEVAMRAAFKAVQDGKQVAVLTPTTVLCEQHKKSFQNRFINFPYVIESVSRFKSKKDQKKVLDHLTEGKIDILIGTHRILSKDVKFKDLGLLIVDEEQRFGVEHKEKIKTIKESTDVLTLTATPIPRTLQLSLMGLKDISVIRTPPTERLSIKTFVAEFDLDLIKSAIENELSRGGQIFFIHNRVHDIDKIYNTLKKLCPNARIVVGHGQMSEKSLEEAMIGFYAHEFDILLSTTIIENGLDVPNANTIIVNRADTFGLSQLYQIRGRVGRSPQKAYAYLLTPPNQVTSGDAKERLSILQRFVELGSGFYIANHDLELRGGGDILGAAQSGHIDSVGYELYFEMIAEEIAKLKGEAPSQVKEEIEINLPFPSLIPENYVPHLATRMKLYRKLGEIRDEEGISQFEQELKDRFGPLPSEAIELCNVVELKLKMSKFGIKSVSYSKKGILLGAGSNPILSPDIVLSLVQQRPAQIGLIPDGRIILYFQPKSSSEITHNLSRLIDSIYH